MKAKIEFVLHNYYPFLCILTLVKALGLNLPLLPLLTLVVLSSIFIIKIPWQVNGVRHLFLLIAYIFFTIINYAINGYPFDIFTSGLTMYFIPAIFFFVVINYDEEQKASFYRRIYYALLITYIIGYYLYFMEPSWFAAYRAQSLADSWLGDKAERYIENYKTFASFFLEEYFIAICGLWALSYTLYQLQRKERFDWLFFFYAIIIIGAIMLAQNRASVVLSVFVILYYVFIESRIKRYRATYLLVVVFLVMFYNIIKYYDELLFLLDRYITLVDGSILDDGRSEQWKNTYRNFNNYIFGEGFNIVGHRAIQYNMNCISDGEIFKILYELGAIGFIIFYSFWFKTLMRAIKFHKVYTLEIPIIVCFVALQYGANPFSMDNIINLFWITAGIVWRPNKVLTQK